MADGHVSLIPFTRDHVEKTFTWVTDAEFQQLFLMRGHPTWVGHQAYFDRVLADPTQCVFAIIHDKVHVGNCGLKNLVRGKDGELWLYVGEVTLRRKKIGRRAADLLLNFGFEVLRLEMIYLHFADFNVGARRLYEHIGFRQVSLKESNSEEWGKKPCEIIRMEITRP
jgi:RimJ/RimL family protein N-acetyltransferase